MTTLLKSAWAGVFSPLLRRPPHVQVAALCWRKARAGKSASRKGGKEILLITSRDTGRWILPKGWPIDGLDLPAAAAQEAWEEAGVKPAKVKRAPIGTFDYVKRLDGGAPAPIEAAVYVIEVADLARDYPEAAERDRLWVSPDKAAEMVEEPALKSLLRSF